MKFTFWAPNAFRNTPLRSYTTRWIGLVALHLFRPPRGPGEPFYLEKLGFYDFDIFFVRPLEFFWGVRGAKPPERGHTGIKFYISVTLM